MIVIRSLDGHDINPDETAVVLIRRALLARCWTPYLHPRRHAGGSGDRRET